MSDDDVFIAGWAARAASDPDRIVPAALADPLTIDALVNAKLCRPALWQRLVVELRQAGVAHFQSFVNAISAEAALRSTNGVSVPEPAQSVDELLEEVASILKDAEVALDDLGSILDGLVTFLRRYVWFPFIEQPWAIALWIVHTYAVEAADTSPRLSIRGPSMRCGKSRLLELLEMVVFRALAAVLITAPVLFRSLDDGPATILLDEADSLFGPKAGDHEELRAVINAGQRRGGTVPRLEGDTAGGYRRVDHPVFAPMAIAGIGSPPSTVNDRAIKIEMQRKKKSENVERLRARKARREAGELAARAAMWVLRRGKTLADAEPALPEQLHDRAQDGWEPLLAIADAAGSEWPAHARQAAVKLSADEDHEDESVSLRVLAAVHAAFVAVGEERGMWGADLVEALKKIDEAPWASWNGGFGIKANDLAKHLRVYGVRARDLKRDGATRRGYYVENLADPWSRYLPVSAQAAQVPPLKVLPRYSTTPTKEIGSKKVLPGTPEVALFSGQELLSHNRSSGVALSEGGPVLPACIAGATEDHCAACPDEVTDVDPDTGAGYCAAHASEAPW